MSDEKPRSDRQTELRRRAEERALADGATTQKALSPDEASRVLHELRVHQIELEVQNEELRRAQAELEASRARYFELYDLAPVGYVTLSEKGLIQEANLTAARLLGAARDALARQPLSRFILPEDQDVYYLLHKRLLDTSSPQVGELRMLRQEGSSFWARMETTIGDEPDGSRGCRAVISDIDEVKAAERARAESERRAQNVTELSPVGLFRTDERGSTTYVNPRWCELSGLSADEAMGAGWLEAVHPDDRERLMKGWEDARSRHEPSDAEYRLLRPDGSIVWVMGQATPERTSEGRVVGYVGTIADITERKRAEEALRESNELLSLFIRHSPVYAYIKNVKPGESRVLRASENFQDMIGTPGSAMAGRTMEELFPPEFAAKITADDWAVVSHGGVLSLDEDLNGRNYRTIKFPITLGDKHLLAGYTIDLTELKQSEEALRQSEKRLRAVLDATPFPIGLADLHDERVLFWSSSAQRLFGHAPPTTTAEWYQMAYPDPEYRREVIDRWKPLLEKARSSGQTVNTGEYRVTGADGSVRICELYVTFLTDELLVTFNDITERKRAEEALMHSRAQLLQSQKLEAVGRLAGGVAHDFNNILQALLSLATVLRLKVGTPELVEVVAEIEDHITRGAGLTKQLLLFSRRQTAEKRKLDLGELASAVGELLRRLIPENIRLSLDTAAEPLWVEGDAGQLEQVLMNLAVNAKDAMPDGGTLTLRTHAGPGEAVIEVTDTGHGMDEETRAHLFEPFFTTKETGKGTGLGLSVVHGIVEQHGGRVEVESSPGEGSCFRVILPSAAGAGPGARRAGRRTAAARRARRAGAPRGGRGRRPQGAGRAAEMLGYEVTAVASGEEARCVAGRARRPISCSPISCCRASTAPPWRRACVNAGPASRSC